MGQIRTAECERIDEELRGLLGSAVAVECQKDTYSLDYIIFVTVALSTGAEEVHPIRVTVEEFEGEDWKANVMAAVTLIRAQAAAGEDA